MRLEIFKRAQKIDLFTHCFRFIHFHGHLFWIADIELRTCQYF